MHVRCVVSVIFCAFAATTIAGSAATADPPASGADPEAVLGVEVGDVPTAYPSRFRSPGVYVIRVVPGSPAEAARIVPGDIITQLNRVNVNDMAGYRSAAATLHTTGVSPIEIRRYGRTLSLNAAPTAPGVLYAKAPACEPDATSAELGAAGVSARRHDDENERAHAAKALDLAETCASLEARVDGNVLMSAGDAFAAIAGADAALTERESSNAYYGDAWVAYHLIKTLPGMTGEQQRAASVKDGAIEQRVPSAKTNNDPAIAEGFSYGALGLGPNAFGVIGTWITSGDSYTRLLHVRVRFTTAKDSVLFANFFRVSVPSSDGPDEAFFASDTPAHPGPRIHLVPNSATKAELAPAEDFGRFGHVFFTAQVPETYVLTFVITDNNADLTNIASTLTYAPQ